MNFTKYSSLENHTNSKFLAKVIETVAPDTEFVAREKIHGTNFSVIVTPTDITPAKRSGPIAETEKFFGYEDLMARYKESFKRIQAMIKFTSGGVSQVQVFGEYAGGGIQKEVDYGEKDFYVFDILINGRYIDDREVVELAKEYGFKVAPLIAYGTLDELLKLPVEFDSIVPRLTQDNLYDVHEISGPTDNVGEGLVIKPVEPLFLPSGSRVAIKYKTDKFKEKGKGQAPKLPTPLSDADKELLFKFSEYVTQARIKNVISHIGEITAKDFGKVLGLTMRDIFVEAEREDLVIDVASAPSKVKAELQKLVQNEIRTIWVDLIN